jgi:tRNA G18 (ribose-2'-O)-methylase SpoU
MLYLDGVQDPGNVGALIRSAAAVGCHAVLAAPHTCRWEHPRVLRASAATALGIPLLWNLEPARLRQLTALPWLALEAHHGDSLWQAELPAGGVLVVGSEAHGISPQTRPFVQLGLNIPLAPEVESLNAAVAAAVVLFEWQRRTLG